MYNTKYCEVHYEEDYNVVFVKCKIFAVLTIIVNHWNMLWILSKIIVTATMLQIHEQALKIILMIQNGLQMFLSRLPLNTVATQKNPDMRDRNENITPDEIIKVNR